MMTSEAEAISEMPSANRTTGEAAASGESATMEALAAEAVAHGSDTKATAGPPPGAAPALAAEAKAHPPSSETAPAGSGVPSVRPVTPAPAEGGPADPLGEALAALDDRDYSTAKRLFAAAGKSEAAEAIDEALAALDRKDYATAQRLFEALAAPKPGTSGSATKALSKPVVRPMAKTTEKPSLDIVPAVEAAIRTPPPRSVKLGPRRRGRYAVVAGVVALALLGGSVITAARLTGAYRPAKDAAMAGLALAAGAVERPLSVLTGAREREEERATMREVGEALKETAARLDRIERDYGGRLDKLDAAVDQNAATKFAELSARLDRIEKKVAASAAAAGSSDIAVAARLERLEKKTSTPAQAPDYADLKTRLDKLEKKTVAPPATSTVKAIPSGPNSAVMAKADPGVAQEILPPPKPTPVLRNYTLDDVQDGVALVESRYGSVQVEPGDVVPGAGRVLRIDRRGGNWEVVTSSGVIEGGPAR